MWLYLLVVDFVGVINVFLLLSLLAVESGFDKCCSSVLKLVGSM